jgi:hypothetical protein
MAIDAILQNINGQREAEVVDSNYSLAHIWPIGDQSFPLLQYIDPYGNTVFNGLQMPEVQRELEILVGKASTDEQKDTLRRIRELAVRCQKQPHMFLRFSGD